MDIQQTVNDYNKLMLQVEKSICKKYGEENIAVSSIGVKETFVIGRYRKQSKYLATNEHRYLITFEELENYNG